mmetsp:Transcript_23186/g.60637  ORF Transcript_23186/g.60637 Transcript_23186/m.60637 type:complete len:468 (+) Transcript_23186:110-1513(+)
MAVARRRAGERKGVATEVMPRLPTRGLQGWEALAAVAVIVALLALDPVAWLNRVKSRSEVATAITPATELLAASVARGAIVHPAVAPDVVMVDSGANRFNHRLTLVVTEAVPVGTVLLSIPTDLALGGRTNTPRAAVAAAAVSLARGRFGGGTGRSSTPDLATLHAKTLPRECPANVAMMTKAETEMLETSVHAHWVAVMNVAVSAVATALPDLSGNAVRWAVCMALSRSRAFGAANSTVVLPLLDLVGDGEMAVVTNAEGGDGWSVIASRDLAAGDPITAATAPTLSQAALWVLRGAASGEAPAAVVDWVPTEGGGADMQRAETVLAQARCRRRASLPIYTDRGTNPTEDAIFRALRCARLEAYTAADAAAAVRSGRLGVPWVDLPFEPRSMLQKDREVIAKVRRQCATAVADANRVRRHATLVRGLRKSSPVAAAVVHETMAVIACADVMGRADTTVAALLARRR